MLIPIKCLTYTLLCNSKYYNMWDKNNIKDIDIDTKYNKLNSIDLKFKNNDIDILVMYENKIKKKEDNKYNTDEFIKTSLFLKYKNNNYYEHVEQKKNLNIGYKYSDKEYLEKSNYFLTKNNNEINYDDLNEDLINDIKKINLVK